MGAPGKRRVTDVQGPKLTGFFRLPSRKVAALIRLAAVRFISGSQVLPHLP